jgi:hypothetical protein
MSLRNRITSRRAEWIQQAQGASWENVGHSLRSIGVTNAGRLMGSNAHDHSIWQLPAGKAGIWTTIPGLLKQVVSSQSRML